MREGENRATEATSHLEPNVDTPGLNFGERLGSLGPSTWRREADLVMALRASPAAET